MIAELAENEALVRIKDNGWGIQADTLAYIIDLFIQANQSLARSEGGLGSGLNMVRNLVDYMCGQEVRTALDGLPRWKSLPNSSRKW